MVAGEIVCAIAMTEPGTERSPGYSHARRPLRGDDYVVSGQKDVHLQRPDVRPCHRVTRTIRTADRAA